VPAGAAAGGWAAPLPDSTVLQAIHDCYKHGIGQYKSWCLTSSRQSVTLPVSSHIHTLQGKGLMTTYFFLDEGHEGQVTMDKS
jgi:hypothetical protein